MLDAAQTLEPAVDHDPQSGAQGFTLLHAVETPGDNVIVHEDNLSKPGRPSPHLCDVSTTERPVLIMSKIKFQRNLRAFGSIPVVGSSCTSPEDKRFHVEL